MRATELVILIIIIIFWVRVVSVFIELNDEVYNKYNDLTKICGYKEHSTDLSKMLAIVEQKKDKEIVSRFEETCINLRHQPNQSLISLIDEIKKNKKTFKEDEEAQEKFVSFINELYQNTNWDVSQKNKVQELKELIKE